jgi:lysyl-tRNA synthetase class 2
MHTDWRPGASIEVLHLRATLLQCVRQFFAQRSVLEVDTPCLLRASATDVHLDSFALPAADGSSRFLQTSPEFAMKRLLAAGSGPIYQLCKCFRLGESSARHNPEFTMLEWYRPGYSLDDLMTEVATLITQLLGIEVFASRAYADVFAECTGLNPHSCSDAELESVARERLDVQARDMQRSDWLDLLMSHLVEPQMHGAVFVYDFPWPQASLSKIERNAAGEQVARRFELFIDGLEIANGYDELRDAGELLHRSEADNAQRQQQGLPAIPIDEKLLAAHRHGLPDCAGVALGFDRVVMLKGDLDHIDQALAFTDQRT